MTEYFRIATLSFIALLTLVNPLAIVPSYLAMTEGSLRGSRKRVALYASVACILVLTIFLFAGEYLFRFFGITIEAFQIMGGILFLTRALRNLIQDENRYEPNQPSWDEAVDTAEPERSGDPMSVAIVPIAIPMLAGPGAISSVMVFVNLYRDFEQRLAVIGAIFAVGIAAWLVMLIAVPVSRLIGERGQAVFAKVMALLLGAIGVQFIINGIRSLAG
ncbi:MAG: MarC family protein [Acidobacteria bacterium]|nr:MarC family protein [Acidobacteriota bacterium]